MSSYNKSKGSKFETDVMKYLRSLGHFAERLRYCYHNRRSDLYFGMQKPQIYKPSSVLG